MKFENFVILQSFVMLQNFGTVVSDRSIVILQQFFTTFYIMGRKIKQVKELYKELCLLRKRQLEAGRNATRKN